MTTCTGEFSWPVKVWAPGVEVAVGKEKGQLEITIPKDLPADRIWVRLFNDEGSSTPFPFLVGGLEEINEEELEDALSKLEESMVANVELDDQGLVIKADAIGSLEGLASELKEAGYSILKAGIGDISKKDMILAETSKPEMRAILGFNVKVLPEAKSELENSDVEVFESDIVYRLLDDYKEWRRKYDLAEEERVRREFAHPGKYEILEGCVFRTRGPAVVGVRVLAGRIAVGQRVLRTDNVVVGRIKSMRLGEEVIKEANQGDEVAIAISNVTVGRQIKENDVLYIEMNERDIIQIRDAGVKLNLDEE